MASGTYSWTCPFCDRPTTVTDNDCEMVNVDLFIANADGAQRFRTEIIVCPNRSCHKASVIVSQSPLIGTTGGYRAGNLTKTWRLIPSSKAKPFPSYIPAPILEDYTEACLVVSDSPKASATLARRCLQGMIRDFYGVSKDRLVDEINAIKSQVDPLTWEAIDAVRSIGNIGAHMEKDINIIIDVDEGEAEELIKLIELLMKDWYINRHERQQQLDAVKAIKAQKDAAKMAASKPPATP